MSFENELVRLTLAAGTRCELGARIDSVKLSGSGHIVTYTQDGETRRATARWVVDAEWEKLMSCPLDQVRERLKLGPPPVYEAIRFEGAPRLATRS